MDSVKTHIITHTFQLKMDVKKGNGFVPFPF